MNLSNLAEALRKSHNAALVVGAGISRDMDIPTGYRLPMIYGETHQELLAKVHILPAGQSAHDAEGDEKWRLEARFVDALVKAFESSVELQQSFLDWLYRFGAMIGEASDIHAAFVIAWLKRVFKHLITTNWDFLLEYHIDALYEESYAVPFEPVHYQFSDGSDCSIEADDLFFLDHLEGDDYFQSPRWDIVANVSDLPNLKRWNRPLWKIHGSPFFLVCLKCGGFSRWKLTKALKVNDPCPEHPSERLMPEIIFWGQGIDKAHPAVWERVKDRLERSDLIVASGFSGSGSDSYIREVVEHHPNAWVINPSVDSWDTSRVYNVTAKASDLAQLLREQFIVEGG